MTLPAWEEPTAGDFDDRQFLIRKEPDPIHQRRGRNNRARGQRSELHLSRFFEAAGWTVYRQGGPNRRDMIIRREGYPTYSVEAKSLKGRRLTPAVGRNAWEQAIRQCGPDERPLAVVRETTANKSTWTVCTPDGNLSLAEWLRL